MKSKTMPSLWSGLDRKIDISPSSLVWIFALANAAVFHGPLIGYVNSNLELTSSLGVGAVMVLLGISLLLMWLLLGGADLASSRFLKPLMVLVTLCNALALYAMETYQVILDKAMMGNVMNTNADESLALFHPRLLIYLLLAGLFCLILFRFFRLKNKTRLNRLGHFVIAVLISLGLIFVNSSSWLWVDKHAKMIGGLLLPWSYTVNTARYLNDQKLASRKLDQLPELIWAADAGLPQSVVDEIGAVLLYLHDPILGMHAFTRSTGIWTHP
jgi:lipid A ethanolaminephosphotransferase